MGIIRLHNLRATSLVGIYARERQGPQPVTIHVELECDMDQAIATDDFRYAVDYEALANDLRATAAGANCYLLEALCAALLAVVMARPGVQRATVRVQKPDAVPAADAVEVELSAQR